MTQLRQKAFTFRDAVEVGLSKTMTTRDGDYSHVRARQPIQGIETEACVFDYDWSFYLM